MPVVMEAVLGTVERRRVGAGSKSDHTAVVLNEGGGRAPLILRRRGGNAFQDDELERLVGKRIAGHGARTSTTFLLDDWKTVD